MAGTARSSSTRTGRSCSPPSTILPRCFSTPRGFPAPPAGKGSWSRSSAGRRGGRWRKPSALTSIHWRRGPPGRACGSSGESPRYHAEMRGRRQGYRRSCPALRRNHRRPAGCRGEGIVMGRSTKKRTPEEIRKEKEALYADLEAGRITLGQATRRMRKIVGLTQVEYAERVLKIYPR